MAYPFRHRSVAVASTSHVISEMSSPCLAEETMRSGQELWLGRGILPRRRQSPAIPRNLVNSGFVNREWGAEARSRCRLNGVLGAPGCSSSFPRFSCSRRFYFVNRQLPGLPPQPPMARVVRCFVGISEMMDNNDIWEECMLATYADNRQPSGSLRRS
jgi:hypothetical protein